MINSKFLKVKKWIGLNEAADRLSLSLEDQVTALDLLELALDREIVLSVKFPRTRKFVIGEIKETSIPYIDKIEDLFYFQLKTIYGPEVNHPPKGSVEYNSLFESYLVEFCLEHKLSMNDCLDSVGDERYPSVYKVMYHDYESISDLKYMDDVIFEIPMLGAEVIDIETLIELNKNREPSELMNLDGVFLRASDGRFFNLMEKFDEDSIKKQEKYNKLNYKFGYINPRHYYPAPGLPKGCEIGISPDHLLMFESRISESDEREDELSEKALIVLGAVLNEVTGKTVKWTQGRLAASIESKNIKGLKERTINGIFSLANKSFKS